MAKEKPKREANNFPPLKKAMLEFEAAYVCYSLMEVHYSRARKSLGEVRVDITRERKSPIEALIRIMERGNSVAHEIKDALLPSGEKFFTDKSVLYKMEEILKTEIKSKL